MDVEEAIVLKYVDGETAPRVVAKGRRLTALRIQELAEKHGVKIVENPPLVKTLISLPIGEFIPEETYKVVAEILLYIYNIEDEFQRNRR